MATIDDVLNALEANENKDELKAVIDGLKAEISKKNSEAKNLRDRFKQSEETGKVAKERFEKLLTREGIELADGDDFDDILEKHYAHKEERQKPDDQKPSDTRELVEMRSTIQKMQREFDKLRKEKDAADKLALEEKERRVRTERDRQIVDALTEGKVISPSKVARIFSEHVKMNDDESLVYVNESGDEITLKEGVAQFLKDNPEFAANYQTPGSGSGGKTGTGGERIYTKAEIEAMDSATRLDLFNRGLLNESLKNLG